MTFARNFFIKTAIASLAGAVISLGALTDALAQATPGGNFNTSSPSAFTPLPTTDTIVGTVTLDLPGPGIVIVNASAWATFNSNPAGVVCAITTGKLVNEGRQPLVVGQNHNLTNARRMPISATRGFEETAAGRQKYRYVCHAQDDADLRDVVLTAIYVPKRYGPRPTTAIVGSQRGVSGASED